MYIHDHKMSGPELRCKEQPIISNLLSATLITLIEV